MPASHSIQRQSNEPLTLPTPAPAAANYDPYVIIGNQVIISGQIAIRDGQVAYLGQVGKDISLDEGYQAARLCGLNILSQLGAALNGNFNQVDRCLKLGGFVSCVEGFIQHPQVINGASDLMMEVFGDRGRHARFAVGATSLPLNTSVEVEACFLIK